MVTDEMLKRAIEAYAKDTGAEGFQLEGWIEPAIRAALEAALSAAEPVAEVLDKPGGFVFSIFPEAFHRIHIGDKLYAAPPTPSVAVKALEWVENVAEAVTGDYWIVNATQKWLYRSPHIKIAPFDTVEAAKSAAQADYEARIRSALSAQVQDVATHRHKKRGTEYVLMGVGKMQAENWQVSVDGFDQSIDMQEVAVYRSVDDGSLWVRPVEEFNDGRFEPLPAAPPKQEG